MPTTTSTTTRKPAAKKTAARKPEAAQAIPVAPAAKDIVARVEEIVTDAVKFVRDAAHTSIGMGMVAQRRLINRDATDKLTVESFLQESKGKGHELATEIQDRVEPIVQRVNERFEPITDRIEANLPAPVKEAIETGRQRVRKLLAA